MPTRRLCLWASGQACHSAPWMLGGFLPEDATVSMQLCLLRRWRIRSRLREAKNNLGAVSARDHATFAAKKQPCSNKLVLLEC